ncbi:MAG: TonB-dependent receptor [Bacteroidetes bacterium]|nr:TonB-dependent receptor [Bacteroidota bacterium]
MFLLLTGLPAVSPCQEPAKEDSVPSLSKEEEGEENEGESLQSGSLEEMNEFMGTWIQQVNRFGSFGSRINGLRSTVRTGNYTFFGSYLYTNRDGFRAHSAEYRHDATVALITTPSGNSEVKIIGSFAAGKRWSPGSLTESEFASDPYQADPRALNRNYQTVFRDGRIDLGYGVRFGRKKNHRFRLSTFGTTDFFDIVSREYRIVSRFGTGLSADYTYTAHFGSLENELTAGGDVSIQPQRTEYYENYSGQKGDMIEQLTSEQASHCDAYLADRLEIIPDRLIYNLNGRLDYVDYKLTEQTLPSRTDHRIFRAFSPGTSLEGYILKWLRADLGFIMEFENPADKELESPDPFYLFNPDLKGQYTNKVFAGIEAKMQRGDSSAVFRKGSLSVSLFQSRLKNEIVPFEVFGDIYYRNAATSERTGMTAKGSLEILRGLVLSALYTYSNYRYLSYTALSIEEDSTGNFIQVDRDFSGNAEPRFPDHAYDVAISYRITPWKHLDILAKADCSGRNAMWVNDANSGKTNSYYLMNFLLRFDLHFGHFNFQIAGGVKNILDKVYTNYVNLNSADKRFYSSGSPQDYQLMLNLAYLF